MGDFQKLPLGSETLQKSSEGLWEMFEGDFLDTCSFSYLARSEKCEKIVKNKG